MLLGLAGCAKDVAITLVAPESFAGGSVLVDGLEVARLERYSVVNPDARSALERRGSIARFGMPLGEHTVVLRSATEAPVAFRLAYERRTEDHIVLDSKMLKILKGRQMPPPLLGDIE